ncbi:hypothetical protein ABZ650_35020, partial [Streptomyces griseoviridis]|uniref:hypothetical protein n=1 Tax=Streptomyces griseoviridis TaxID=45398 RepID=UPI0033F89E07
AKGVNSGYVPLGGVAISGVRTPPGHQAVWAKGRSQVVAAPHRDVRGGTVNQPEAAVGREP